MNVLRLFAAEDGPHISLAPEEIFKLGDFVITNSMIYGLILSVFMVIFLRSVAKKASIKPVKGVVAVVEMILEHILGMMEGVFGNRKTAIRFLPVFAVYFIYIMFSNISGLLPWVGGITGGPEGVPTFRPFTADLNGVVAMAIFAIVTVQVLSIKEQGFKSHIQHYFGDNPKNLINLFVGVLESIGEITRVLSLSLRLFLNTVIGEILVTVFIDISGPATSVTLVPIILFELLVAYIQAYVFTVLAATYLGLAIAHHAEHEEHDDHSQTAHSTPDELKSVGVSQ